MEGGLEKIQSLEDALLKTRDEKTTETKGMAPVFTVPLSNINDLREGESAHFEGRLIPTDDPKLKVSYYCSTVFLSLNTIIPGYSFKNLILEWLLLTFA